MNGTTCVPVAEKRPDAMIRSAKKALGVSELAELRLDFLAQSDVPDVLERLSRRELKRCVCTLRPPREGGMFAGTEAERASVLKTVAGYGPYSIDVEYTTVSRNGGLAKSIKSSGTPMLVSWHDFDGTPGGAALAGRLARMTRHSNHVKIVTTAKTHDDVSRVLALYGRWGGGGGGGGSGNKGGKNGASGLVAFAMGDVGRISRLLCLYLGSPYTYASLGKKAVAAGQYSVQEVKRITELSRPLADPC